MKAIQVTAVPIGKTSAQSRQGYLTDKKRRKVGAEIPVFDCELLASRKGFRYGVLIELTLMYSPGHEAPKELVL